MIVKRCAGSAHISNQPTASSVPVKSRNSATVA